MLNALYSVKDARLAAVWRLAAMTVMRRGEILGLRWRDVDLDAARPSVRQAVVAVAYEVIESTPKSHNARVIDLDGETVGLLRALNSSSGPSGWNGAQTTGIATSSRLMRTTARFILTRSVRCSRN